MTQQLPQGFSLDEPEQLSGLPQGFSLDEPEPTFGERVRAVGDVAGAMIGGAIAEPIAGVAGLLSMPFGGAEGAAQVVEDVREVPAAIPKSELGQEYLQNIGAFFGKAADKLNPMWRESLTAIYSAVPGVSEEERLSFKENVGEEGMGKSLGDAVRYVTGSDELGAIASANPAAVMEILGFGGARKLAGDIPKSSISQRPAVALSQATPDVSMLKQQSKALYKEVDELGYVVPKDDFVNLAIKIREELNAKGLDPTLTPKAEQVLKRIEDSIDKDLKISDIDTLRQIADIPAKAIDNPREVALGASIKDIVDDFIDLQGKKLRAQGRLDVAEKITNARTLYSRVKKSELLDEAIEKAKVQQSGFENGLRIQFRQLLNNKRKMRGFSESEKEAMRKVVEGGGLENSMRALGKFGVIGAGGGPQSTVLAPLIGGSVATAITGNPVALAAVPVIGQVSRELATKLTANNSRMAQQIVQAGSNGSDIARAYLRNTPKAQQSLSDLTELLMRTEVDLSTIKDMSGDVGRLINDAKFAAELLRDMGMTSLIAVPGAAAGVQEANEEAQQ